MLEIEKLCVSYGEMDVLNAVCMEVNQGKIVAIVGSNGSGKTTILRSISGLLPVSSGRMTFLNMDITHLRPDKLVRMGICQVPEGRHIFPTLSVYDNIEMGAYLRKRGQSRANFRNALQFVFTLFPILEKRRQQKGGTLSGGEQQMLAIARALMAEPKLLMLDEPSMGLAPMAVRTIFDTLKHLNKQGLTVLLVEQDVKASLAISWRGYVLQLGRIAFEGTGQELLADKAVKAIYLGEKSGKVGHC